MCVLSAPTSVFSTEMSALSTRTSVLSSPMSVLSTRKSVLSIRGPLNRLQYSTGKRIRNDDAGKKNAIFPYLLRCPNLNRARPRREATFSFLPTGNQGARPLLVQRDLDGFAGLPLITKELGEPAPKFLQWLSTSSALPLSFADSPPRRLSNRRPRTSSFRLGNCRRRPKSRKHKKCGGNLPRRRRLTHAPDGRPAQK